MVPAATSVRRSGLNCMRRFCPRGCAAIGHVGDVARTRAMPERLCNGSPPAGPAVAYAALRTIGEREDAGEAAAA